MFFQLMLTKFFKKEPLSCLPKVDHVIKSCKSLFDGIAGALFSLLHTDREPGTGYFFASELKRQIAEFLTKNESGLKKCENTLDVI